LALAVGGKDRASLSSKAVHWNVIHVVETCGGCLPQYWMLDNSTIAKLDEQNNIILQKRLCRETFRRPALLVLRRDKES